MKNVTSILNKMIYMLKTPGKRVQHIRYTTVFINNKISCKCRNILLCLVEKCRHQIYVHFKILIVILLNEFGSKYSQCCTLCQKLFIFRLLFCFFQNGRIAIIKDNLWHSLCKSLFVLK